MKTLIPILFFIQILFFPWMSEAVSLDPVTLSTPTNVSGNSVTLAWDPTTTADSDFGCYKIMFSRSGGADLLEVTGTIFLVPALGTAALILLFTAFALILSRTRQKMVLGGLVLGIMVLGFTVFTSAQTILVDCIPGRATNSYTVTGLDPGARYYFKVYVFGKDGSSVESNEVVREPLTISSVTSTNSTNRFDEAVFGNAVFE